MSNLDLSLYRSIEALADNDIPNPILRIDFFLHAVITGEECNIEPVTKTEEYLYALATGDESRLGLYGDSISLLEEYLEALRTGDTSNLREPRTREEIILYQAVTGEDLGVEPVSRIETYLSMLQNAGGLDYILSTSTNASVIPLTNSINGRARVQEMCGDTIRTISDGYVTDGLKCLLDGLFCSTDGITWDDLSGNGNHGVLSNSTGVSNNGAFKYSGGCHIPNVTKGLNSYTIECRVKVLDTNFWAGICGNTGTSGGNSLYFDNASRLGLYPGQRILNFNKNVKETPITITFVYQNNVGKIYIDGVYLGVISNALTVSSADKMVLCARKANNTFDSTTIFNDARMCDWYSFRIYDRVLSDDEILSNYNHDLEKDYVLKSCGETKDNMIDIRVSNDINTSTHTIQLPQPLRGLPNGVQDRIVYLDENTTPIAPEGKGLYLEKNVEEVYFDGSDDEKWTNLTNTNGSVYYSSIKLDGLNPNQNVCSVISDKFVGYHGNGYKYDMEMVYAWNNGSMYIHILKNKLEEQSNVAFRKYLNNNPFSIVYHNVNPTYTKISDVDLKCYKDATVYVDSGAVAPTKTVIHYPYKQPTLFSL